MHGVDAPSPVLVVVAHGTRSTAGLTTVESIAEAVRRRRPDIDVRLAYLDVAEPTLVDVLDELDEAPAVVVPMLLSRGYHVDTDIPAIIARYPHAVATAHLGADPALVTALADRVSAVEAAAGVSTVLAAVGSTRPQARAEVDEAARLLAERLGRPVLAVGVDGPPETVFAALPTPVTVVPYLIASGTFLDRLRAITGTTVAEPIGAHPALVGLLLARYDAVAGIESDFVG